MQIDRHVYGSINGYRTLARSNGVSSAEVKTLEGLHIGQSTDPSFMQSLVSRPAFIIRTIGARRAITRVTMGPPDDANRPTIIRVTLLFSAADWDGPMKGDVSPLIGNKRLWEWDGQAQLATLNAPVDGQTPRVGEESVQKLLSVISLLERSWQSRKPVVLRENTLSLDEFRLLGMLIPPAARSGYGGVYRSLTREIQASLICLAQQAPVRSGTESFRTGQSVELSSYARALAGAGLENGTFPFAFIQSYRSFGMPPRRAVAPPAKPATSSVSMPPQVIVERMPRGILVALLLTCVFLALVSSLCTYIVMKNRHERAMADNQEQMTAFERDLNAVRDDLNALHDTMHDSLNTLADVSVAALVLDDRKKLKQACLELVNVLPVDKQGDLVQGFSDIDVARSGWDRFEHIFPFMQIPSEENIIIAWHKGDSDSAKILATVYDYVAKESGGGDNEDMADAPLAGTQEDAEEDSSSMPSTQRAEEPHEAEDEGDMENDDALSIDEGRLVEKLKEYIQALNHNVHKQRGGDEDLEKTINAVVDALTDENHDTELNVKRLHLRKLKQHLEEWKEGTHRFSTPAPASIDKTLKLIEDVLTPKDFKLNPSP